MFYGYAIFYYCIKLNVNDFYVTDLEWVSG